MWFSVLYNEVTIHFFNLFITISHMWKFSSVNTFQHWLLYDTFSSNNSSNNNYVSVVQICFSDLTACRTFVLYQHTLIAAANDANSVLLINAQQLRAFIHSFQIIVILALFDHDVFFVQRWILRQQVLSHQSLYINEILIQRSDVLISDSCTDCQKHSMMLFLKCCHMSEHFKRCYSNCKWCDHAAHCFIHNNDVVIVISDDNDDNDEVNESKQVSQQQQIASALLLTEVVVINLNS